MIRLLNILWTEYKLLGPWEKILLFLPWLIVIFLVCISMFWKTSDSDGKFRTVVARRREEIDHQIETIGAKDQALAAQGQELETNAEVITERIKEHERSATEIFNAINTAAANNDQRELLRLHSALNRRHNVRATVGSSSPGTTGVK